MSATLTIRLTRQEKAEFKALADYLGLSMHELAKREILRTAERELRRELTERAETNFRKRVDEQPKGGLFGLGGSICQMMRG